MKAQLKPRIHLDNRPKLETLIPLATPLVVHVDPASACNLKCVFCPTGYHDLIAESGRFVGAMKFDLFCKIIDDLAEFNEPIKVLRLYSDGEPFLNKRLADMVAYAKQSGRVGHIDTTTNGSLLSPERVGPVLEAGLDRINISVNGMTEETYLQVTGVKFNLQKFIENVKWLYANKGQCEVAIKTLKDFLSPSQLQEFYDTFGNHCDLIFAENYAPCWPQFDIEKHTGVKITKGIYDNPIHEVEVCPYIFYSFQVNADGLAGACFQDWKRQLVIGDARKQSMRQIWNSDKMNALRLQHLEGKRKQLPGPCGNCGQVSHCMSDDIDPWREELLVKFKEHLAVLA